SFRIAVCQPRGPSSAAARADATRRDIAPARGWRPTVAAWHPARMHPGIHAQNHPDKPALIVPSRDVTVTYRQLDESSNRAAQLFPSLGLVPDARLGLLVQ